MLVPGTASMMVAPCLRCSRTCSRNGDEDTPNGNSSAVYFWKSRKSIAWRKKTRHEARWCWCWLHLFLFSVLTAVTRWKILLTRHSLLLRYFPPQQWKWIIFAFALLLVFSDRNLRILRRKHLEHAHRASPVRYGKIDNERFMEKDQ